MTGEVIILDMKNIHRSSLSAIACFAFAVSCPASLISWTVGDVSGVSGLGDLAVSTNGVLVEAVNFGGDGVPSPVINGVTFTGVDVVAPGTSSPNSLVGLPYEDSQIGNGETGIGNIDVLLDTIGFDSQVNQHTADLVSLIPGRTYEVQFFLSHTPTAGRSQVIFGDEGSGAGAVMRNANPSQFSTGTFVADGVTQSLTFDNLSTGSQLLSGYQLRDLTAIPEPTSGAFVLTGLLVIVGIRRVFVGS